MILNVILKFVYVYELNQLNNCYFLMHFWFIS